MNIHVVNRDNTFIVQIDSKKELDKQQTESIRQKVIAICQSVLGQMTDQLSVKQVNFSIQSKKEFSIKVVREEGAQILDSASLGDVAKKEMDELVGLVAGIGHYHLSKVEKKRVSPPDGVYETIKRFFQRTTFYYTLLQPTIGKMVQEAFKGKTIDGMGKIYTDSALYVTIKSKLLVENPNYQNVYEESEIDALIQTELLQGIQKALISLKKPPLTDSDLNKLEISRLLNRLKDYSFTPQDDLYQKLHKISPIELPLEELKKIPVTQFNKKELAKIWMSLLGNLFTKGHLSQLGLDTHRKGSLVQEHYAARYLKALSAVPEKLKDVEISSGGTFKSFCEALNKKKSSKLIKDFIVHRMGLSSKNLDSSILDKVTGDISSLEADIKIYEKILEPVLNQFKKDICQMGELEIASHASGEKDTLRKKYLEKANGILTKQQKVYFSDQRLIRFFYHELESFLLFEKDFNSNQIQALRGLRKVQGQEKKFTVAMSQYVESEKKFTLIKGSSLSAKKKALEDYSMTTIPFVKIIVFWSADTSGPHIGKVESSLVKINEQIEALNKKRLELEKDLTEARGNSKSKISKEFKAISEQLINLRMQKGVAEEALQAFKAKDQNRLFMLLPLISIPMGKENFRVDTLEETHLNQIKKVMGQLKEELKTLRQGSSSEDMKSRMHLITEKIHELDQFLIMHSKIDPLKKEIAAYENKVNLERGLLNQKTAEWFQNLLDKGISVEALANIKSSKIVREVSKDFLVLLWSQLFKHMFVKGHLHQFSSNAKMNGEIKIQFQEYLRAKALLHNLSKTFPDVVKEVDQVINKLENDIPSGEIIQYLKGEVPVVGKESANDVVFSDAVVSQVRETQNHYSAFTSKQQGDLMYLTRVFNKIANKEELTRDEKAEVKTILKRFENDSIMKRLIKVHQEGVENNEAILSYFPSFLRGIVKFFMPPTDPFTHMDVKLRRGVSNKVMEFLNNYSTALKKIGHGKKTEDISSIIDKTEALLEKQNKKENINADERLTVKELSQLSRLSRLNEDNLFQDLGLLGLLDENEKSSLKNVETLSKKSTEILKKLESAIRPSLNEHYPSGTVMAFVDSKKTVWTGRPSGVEERLTAYIGNGLTHGAKLYHDKVGNLKISHVYGSYTQEPMTLYQLCISDFWAIDVVPLIHSSLHSSLQKIYGSKWKENLNKKYQEIEMLMHQRGKTRFDELKNEGERRIKAGLADYKNWARLFGMGDMKGHEFENEESEDLKQLHKQFFKGKALEGKQICSEFASRATAAAMLELNEQINFDLRARLDFTGPKVLDKLAGAGIEVTHVKPLLMGEEVRNFEEAMKNLRKTLESASTLYSKEDIESICRLVRRELVELPYSKKERFEAIHPGRMVKLLADRGCVKRIVPPAAVTALIDLK